MRQFHPKREPPLPASTLVDFDARRLRAGVPGLVASWVNVGQSSRSNSGSRLRSTAARLRAVSRFGEGRNIHINVSETLDNGWCGAKIPDNSQMSESVGRHGYEQPPANDHHTQLSPERGYGSEVSSSSCPGRFTRRRRGIRGMPRMPRDLRIE